MNTHQATYCLDANVLIQAWQKYYSPDLCQDYWRMLNELGKAAIIFLPKTVAEEIFRTEDRLSIWLKESDVPIREISSQVTNTLTEIFNANPLHQHLVDNIKGRSLADPWVVAHALHEKATVVTKEEKVTQPTNRIKIPNVCENMGIRWMNDFEMLLELGIRFSCSTQTNKFSL